MLQMADLIVVALIGVAGWMFFTRRFPLFIVTTAVVLWLIILIAIGVL